MNGREKAAKDYKIGNMQSILDIKIEKDYEAGLPVDLIEVETLEKDGGPCPRCGAPWRKVERKNRYADFYYYDPACECYRRCGSCGTSLHREDTVGADPRHCPSCYFDLHPGAEDETQVKRYTKKYTKKAR